jgi:tetratricopeptide (TPR) repeat protein
MDYFSTADALIIDLRENGGGNSLGLYWSSYFLEENVALSAKYERRTDIYSELKTVKVQGERRLNIPLYILTSNFTFSAAEAFAYDLQSRNRAVVVGENTGGGAHPVNFMRLNHGFGIIMPYARSINPVTKSNWEGVGVQPDVLSCKHDALVKAKDLAKIAAKKYREQPFFMLKEILAKEEVSQKDKVKELLELLLKRKHLEDFMVNDMGYFYLDNDQINSAMAIFEANVKIFPESPNAHDSYAEGLALQGEKEEALNHFKTAVRLAEAQNDRRLDMYINNLSNFEANLKP